MLTRKFSYCTSKAGERNSDFAGLKDVCGWKAAIRIPDALSIRILVFLS